MPTPISPSSPESQQNAERHERYASHSFINRELISVGRRRASGTVTEEIAFRDQWGERRDNRFSARCVTHGTHAPLLRNRHQASQLAFYPASFCSECSGARNADEAGARRGARMGTGTGRRGQRLGITRKFGVEIEFTGNHYAAQRAIQRKVEDGSLSRGWRVKLDSSCGSELIGPPLKGERGLAEVRVALTAIVDEAGASVNRSCGLHVHHDVADIGAEGIKRVARSYAANQALIDWLVSPSRRRGMNVYCGHLDEDDLNYMDRYSSERALACETRYKTVNVASFARHGTVEFRQHQGTLSYDKIVSWIKLGQGMLDTVAEAGAPFGTAPGIRSLMEGMGIDEDARDFLVGRAINFGADPTMVAA